MKSTNCPLFVDFTRECIQKIGYMPNDSMFKFCSSSSYVKCPLYRALNNVGNHCEYVYSCVVFRYYGTRNIDKFLEVTQKYCLADTQMGCARYRMKKKGQSPPPDLLPDGGKIEGSSEE